MPAYRMDPPRGKGQYAMVTVTGKSDDVFVADIVQLLSEEEAMHVKDSLLKLLGLAVEINASSLTMKRPWTPDESHVKAKKCKMLGRCPTGEPMDMPFC